MYNTDTKSEQEFGRKRETKMSEKQIESLYNMPRIQAMIDKDLKEYGYLRRATLKYLGSLNIILDKNFKAKVAK